MNLGGSALIRRAALLGALVVSVSSCSLFDDAYYRAMETFGKEKRDLLADQVEEARDSQTEAKEQFESALEEFSALIAFDGGDLEDLYNRLEREYERSLDRANEVRGRVDDVEDVAGALFDEWGEELDRYQSQELRRSSEQQRDAARDRYEDMIRAMRRAEEKMLPVLEVFEDQVLVLKHDLNARAISALEGTLETLETDVALLIEDMNLSIEEADRFVEEMRG